MKALLVCEYRQGKLLDASYELIAFAELLGADKVCLIIGSAAEVPRIDGKVYLADVAKHGEYSPDRHKALVLRAVELENPDSIVFLHSSYGWDLAPRVAAALKAGQISAAVGITADGQLEVSFCNGKLRRIVAPRTPRSVITIQAGAFSPGSTANGTPRVEQLDSAAEAGVNFIGYEAAAAKEVDLAKAGVIVSAGRGIGKKESVAVVADLARALGGEVGASRPAVDSGWLEHSRQIGTTGQSVSPKLCIACGISGAIQHLAGMKKADFVVAINKDRDAPIGAIADVLVVADAMQFVPALTARLLK